MVITPSFESPFGLLLQTIDRYMDGWIDEWISSEMNGMNEIRNAIFTLH